MILAHLSDLHLGFRAHGRRDRGRDARERDVLDVLERAVRELEDLRPDVVVVTGDVFDRADPDAGVILTLARALEALQAALPGLPVALLAGPRDLPLHRDEAGPLDVAGTWDGVVAATLECRSLRLGEGRLHLALAPHGALVADEVRLPPPDSDARFNVLAAHGRVARGEGGRGRGAGAMVDLEAWDYVALGGEHGHREVTYKARYAGSLERVGWTPWGEALEEKGFVSVDLEEGRASFHPLPVRPVVALAPIRVPPGDPGRLLRRVREVTDEVPGGIDDRIVRLRLQGPAPADLRALQGGLLTELRARALHLGVVVEEPDDPPPPQRDPVERLARLLESAGGSPGDAEALLPRPTDVEGDPPGPGPRQLRVGGVQVRLARRGLAALVGREPRERWALGRALRDAAEEDAWAMDADGAALLEAVTLRLAGPWVEGVDRALEGIRRGRPGASSPATGPSPPGAAEAPPRRLRALERELRELRANDVEVMGDVEQAAMEWTRERQDAETQLTAYRDRARELKVRLRQLEAAGEGTPCPTCGRPLTDHFADVVETLRDEWEAVVQDGRWWKRRREQLEDKPSALRELEGRALRVHAEVEACAERLERARARALASAPAPAGPPSSAEGPAGEGPPPAPPPDVRDTSPAASALRRLRAELHGEARRRAVLRTSRVVEQITGGRVAFVSVGDDGVPRPEGHEGPLDDPAGEEAAAVRLALLAVLAASRPGSTLLLPEGTLESLAATDALRAVEVLRALLRSVPRVVVVTDGRAVDRRPEAFDQAVELEGEGRGAWARPLPVGTGLLVLR